MKGHKNQDSDIAGTKCDPLSLNYVKFVSKNKNNFFWKSREHKKDRKREKRLIVNKPLDIFALTLLSQLEESSGLP
jgi:hypothetical protein